MDINYFNDLMHSLRTKFPFAREIEITVHTDVNEQAKFSKELNEYVQQRGMMVMNTYPKPDELPLTSVRLPNGLKLTVKSE